MKFKTKLKLQLSLCILLSTMTFVGCATTNFKEKSIQPSNSELHGQHVQNYSFDHRLIIYDATLEVKVKSIDKAISELKLIANKDSGYVLTIRDSSVKMRVKVDKLDEVIKNISTIGKMKSKQVSGTDVTEDYSNSQIKLENIKKTRQRYLELLSKSENVATTLLVEKELERLQIDNDLLEAKLNKLNHLMQFSTVTIYLKQKEKLGVLGYICVGVYEGVKWLFVR